MAEEWVEEGTIADAALHLRKVLAGMMDQAVGPDGLTSVGDVTGVLDRLVTEGVLVGQVWVVVVVWDVCVAAACVVYCQ